jgi:hypothetical protein
MATDYARDLDAQLIECKLALQGQAQAMLDLLMEFEARLQARLDAAEARIAAVREASARGVGESYPASSNGTSNRPQVPG